MKIRPPSLYLNEVEDFLYDPDEKREYFSHKDLKPERQLKIDVFNATDFDDNWLYRQIQKCAKAAGIYWPISFWFVESGWSQIAAGMKDEKWLGQTNCFDDFICEISPQVKFPFILKRYGEIYSYVRNKHALCKYIIAHELCHATGGHPENFDEDYDGFEQTEDYCDLFATELAGTKIYVS